MQKATLQQNILPTAKQRMLVNGAEANIIHLSRDPLMMEVGVINLADQTRVPGGRKRSGDFAAEIQFARDEDRTFYRDWFKQCIDMGGGTSDRGIDPAYKKDVTCIYLRLFQGSSGASDSGSELSPVKVRLKGCWVSKVELPKADIKEDNGDSGDTIMKITLNFDNISLLEKDQD